MRKYRYNPSWQTKRKSWLRNTLLIVVIALPLLVLMAELIARGAVLATGGINQLTPNKTIAIAQSYAFRLQDNNGNNYPGLPDAGKLRVRRSPLLGYELLPDQNSEFWQVNAQGFRQDSTVPSEKPANEIRVFLVGGSTAFTNMAEQNQKALAFKIEKLLNERVRSQNTNPERFKPRETPYFADQIEAMQTLPPRIREGSYRVIAAAVPGYASGNELALIAHRVMTYSPNALVLLDGYEDMRSPSNQVAKEIGNIDQLLRDPIAQYRQHQGQQFSNWLNSLYLVKAWQKWVAPVSATTFSSDYQVFSAEQFSKDAKESQARIDRYFANLQKISKLASNIPILVALQPEITGKLKSLVTEEENILQALGNEYRDRAIESYQLADRTLNGKLGNVKFLNFYQLFQDSKRQAFIDPIHLTEGANDLLAKKLYDNLEQLFLVQPAPNPLNPEILPTQRPLG